MDKLKTPSMSPASESAPAAAIAAAQIYSFLVWRESVSIIVCHLYVVRLSSLLP